MKNIPLACYLIISLLLALACGFVGFFVGGKYGIAKGASITASIARSNLDLARDFAAAGKLDE